MGYWIEPDCYNSEIAITNSSNAAIDMGVHDNTLRLYQMINSAKLLHVPPGDHQREFPALRSYLHGKRIRR